MTVEELRATVAVEEASTLLERAGVDQPGRRLDQFLAELPDLLSWLATEGRVFPWRETTDPWKVYVAEILLQRTRAAAVEELFHPFFDRFQDPAALREASDEEIHDVVRPLGFGNHRTRTLREVAELLADHDDSVPADPDILKRPWRVGPYSARATMLFAFGEPMALVDTNFARIIERVFGYELPRQPHKSDEVYEFMDALVPDDPALCRAVNLALLDLGAAICTPEEPLCQRCPLLQGCEFGRTGGIGLE